jgi:hypothetical protein
MEWSKKKLTIVVQNLEDKDDVYILSHHEVRLMDPHDIVRWKDERRAGSKSSGIDL